MAGVLVGVPVSPAEAGVCYNGSASGYEDVWLSDGDDFAADRLESSAGVVLVGREWRVPVCVGFDGSVRVTGSVTEVVSAAAAADESRALTAVGRVVFGDGESGACLVWRRGAVSDS